MARVIQGVAGGMVPVAFGIIRDEFPGDKVASAVGALAALTAVGAGLGIVLAGPIVNALDYHWLFWLPMILTIAAAISAVLFVPESPVRTPGRISWLPAVLLSAWLVALLVALSEAPDWGWGSRLGGKVLVIAGCLIGATAVRAAAGVRLHDRLRGHDQRPGTGGAGRPADPVGAAAAAGGRRTAGRRAGPGGRVTGTALEHPPRAGRRDAVRNYHRILDAAREVLGESGAEASMEEIAARAGVGIGTVYRKFASKDALIDELLRLAMEEVSAAADRALARTDGHGLEELLRALGQSFAGHARYANLLLDRPADPAAGRRIRAAIGELTARATAAGTVDPGITAADVMALVWAMRGLVHAAGEVTPPRWQRFLDIHLAGLRAAPGPALL